MPGGRPPIGVPVQVRLGPLLAELDDWAQRHHMSRAQALREAVRRLVSTDMHDAIRQMRRD